MSHAQENDTDCDEEKIIPPDGGWGWVVVWASFMIHIITDGITYTFGIFFVVLVKYFNASNSATSWICSILVGVTLCSGPLSSAFVNKYGCRSVTIAGALLASASFIASVFATSIMYLYITVGIGVGFGLGLIYLPAIVSVTCYFEKKRSLATGIGVCGSGLGTFLFAPLTTYLLGEYGWRGSMLIIGGLLLNCIIFGIIFRPLTPQKKKNILLVSQNNDHNTNDDIQLNNLYINGNDTKIPNDKVINVNEKNGLVPKRPHSVHLYPNTSLNQMNGSAVTASTNLNGANTLPIKSSNTNRLAVSQPHLNSDRKLWGSQVLHTTNSGVIVNNKQIFYRGSLAHIPQTNRSSSSVNMKRSRELRSSTRKPSGSNLRNRDEDESKCGLSSEFYSMLVEMMDFSLLKDPIFLLFTFSNFCTSVGFNVPYVYILAKANQLGVPLEEGNKIIAVIGIANTIGRIALGYLSDKPWVNRLGVYNWCLTICGVATILSAFCTSLIEFYIYASVFGFTIGAYVGLTSVILVDLMGLDKLTNAFGLLLLFQGIASFIGPPIVGCLYDISLSYDPGFYLAGVMIAFSGVILFVIPRMQRSQKKSMVIHGSS